MTGGQTNLLSPSRSGASIIARGKTDEGWPFLQYSFLAGAETSEDSNGGISGGRKFASRPFLHSSPLHSSPFLDDNTGNALYNFGWNWSVDLVCGSGPGIWFIDLHGTGSWIRSVNLKHLFCVYPQKNG